METVTPALEASASPQLRGKTAEEELCRSLPRQDPIEAQRLLCEAVSRLVSSRAPDERQLSALLTFDQHAHPISKRLLILYADGDAQLRSLDRQFFIAAQRLSRSFAQACEHFLAHIENSADKSWHARACTVLVQLFRHRQVELLLRLFRYKKRNSELWRQLHAAYQSARAQGLASDCLPRSPAEDRSAPEPTVEQQFIQILLLGVMSTGQFSPRELLWAGHWIARWRVLLTLQSIEADGRTRGERNGFVVDLRGAEGPRRFSSGETGDLLHLDTAPLVAAIDETIAALDDAPTPSHSPIPTEKDPQVALLSRLRTLFAPVAVHIERRGERKPVAYSVQAISGLPHIVQMLREETQRKKKQNATSAAQLEDITILPTGGHTRMSTSVLGTGGLGSFSIATTFGARPQVWQVKDHSDSGCRMRGQTSDLNGLIPGSLIAFRESENAQWTVGVIRRLRRLMVDYVEISVEHIGQRPRYVKMVTGDPLAPLVNDVPNNNQKCFGALYVPASEKHPTMPIQTLLVPATAFNAGAAITLLSSKATYTLRLNKPLERQAGFVWTSFAVVDKVVARSQQAPGAMAMHRPYDNQKKTVSRR